MCVEMVIFFSAVGSSPDASMVDDLIASTKRSWRRTEPAHQKTQRSTTHAKTAHGAGASVVTLSGDRTDDRSIDRRSEPRGGDEKPRAVGDDHRTRLVGRVAREHVVRERNHNFRHIVGHEMRDARLAAREGKVRLGTRCGRAQVASPAQEGARNVRFDALGVELEHEVLFVVALRNWDCNRNGLCDSFCHFRRDHS